MPKRVTVYVADATLLAAEPAGSLSGGINRAADRYREICRRSRIADQFAPGEWEAVLDALRGWLAEPAAMIAGGPAAEVEDAMADGLAEQHGIDGPALGRKLRSLSYADEVALVDAVERYWHRVSPDARPE